jgi:hypothetical protein
MRRTLVAALFAFSGGIWLVACSKAHVVADGGQATGGQAASGGSPGGAPSGGGNPAKGGDSANAGSVGDGAGTAAGGSLNAGGSGGAVGVPDEDAPGSLVSYAPSSAVILNPERGFYATTSLVGQQDLSQLRESGVTLVHSYVRLDAYRTADLPQSLLDQVDAGFVRVRAAGLKVVLRFSYNDGPYPNAEPDAPKDWVLKHITQLKPLLERNADAIAVVQAGFIGAWGEWHTSTNDLTAPATRKEILEALVAAVPTSRFVQLRYPPYKRELYGDALTEAQAFGTSMAARVGHHNDCFVSSATDVGTYPDAQIDFYRDYVGADTAFVPMGGETCAVSAPRSECTSALAEMTKLHMSYVNREFQSDVLASWQPCREEMEKRLGYRLRLETAQLPGAVKPGGSFRVTLVVKNEGFAAPFNARPVFLVLRGAGTMLRVQLQKADPRRWLTGGSITARLRLPSALATGTYALSVWLPDAADALENKSEYAVQLANDGIWDAASGENTLGKVEVTNDAPGSAATDADTFAVLGE